MSKNELISKKKPELMRMVSELRKENRTLKAENKRLRDTVKEQSLSIHGKELKDDKKKKDPGKKEKKGSGWWL